MDKTNSLKETLRQIPELPGIYKMLDSGRNIIYIGKSKCLKRRVASYFVNSPKWEKVNRMVSQIKDIEYIVTDTHLEARLLECELIKYHQPRYNAQMKNDRRYGFIKVNAYNPHRSLSVIAEREDNCFGPFRSKFKMGEFIDKLKNLYPIRKTDDGYEAEYHLFPIGMDRDTFDRNHNVLLELMTEEDNIDILIDCLQKKLLEAADKYRYEIASYYRDIIIGFTTLKRGLNGYKDLNTKDILLTLPVPDGFKLFYITCGNIINRRLLAVITDKDLQDFLVQSRLLHSSYIPPYMDEKSSIDFRDVLYSEISDLDEEQVTLL